MTMDQMKTLGTDENSIKQNIGEKIYVKVINSGHDGDSASRITGILIDQTLEDIRDMISTEASLTEKIGEADQLMKSQQ